MQDCFSDECLRFEYNRWISLTKNDGKEDIMAEIPALRSDQEPRQGKYDVCMCRLHEHVKGFLFEI